MQHLNDVPVKEIREGFFGKMIHGSKSTLVFWEIKKGSILEEHFHYHEQITHVIEGELKMKIGGEEYLLGPGTVHVIPSNIAHGAVALSDCKVIDSFSPARDDYK
ncbi:MAG: cupin domain-containing protein [Bacteroidetes bacterium]|nr:cupin domain-containing protein [Bacteroidota bacterium]MBS1974748.1 cupin domain-containing protein [Bacteroidota bacterium]